MTRVARSLSLVLILVAPPALAQPARRVAPRLPVIDVHVHAEFTGAPTPGSGIVDSRDELLAAWRQAGVRAAVVHEPNADADKFALRDRRAIHCAGIALPVDTAQLERQLQARSVRCIKVYLGYVHAFAADPRYHPVYRLAEKFDVPVVFHTGDPNSRRAKLKYADPLTVDEVAVDHPNVRFVIAHCGNPWIESAAEVAYKNPNVFLECSAMVVGDSTRLRRLDLEQLVVKPIAWVFTYVEDPTKLMFGSDWPLVDVASYVAAYKRAIPPRYWRSVFYENAARVFKISPDTAGQ
jgi:predicted TIM-barrel fold metal-dependent hydrolase